MVSFFSLSLSPDRPFAYFPTGDKFCHAVKFCPTRFCLRDGEENPFPFPYRIIFAVATQNSVIFYDTQQVTPFACLSDIHYTRISDIAWSADARVLIVSSTDGFCTFVSFAPGELGQVYEGEPFKYEPLCVTPGKAPPETEAEPVTPDAPVVSSIKTPSVVTPSVVTFFRKIPKQKRLQTIQKELEQLKSTPKRKDPLPVSTPSPPAPPPPVTPAPDSLSMANTSPVTSAKKIRRIKLNKL